MAVEGFIDLVQRGDYAPYVPPRSEHVAIQAIYTPTLTSHATPAQISRPTHHELTKPHQKAIEIAESYRQELLDTEGTTVYGAYGIDRLILEYYDTLAREDWYPKSTDFNEIDSAPEGLRELLNERTKGVKLRKPKGARQSERLAWVYQQWYDNYLATHITPASLGVEYDAWRLYCDSKIVTDDDIQIRPRDSRITPYIAVKDVHLTAIPHACSETMSLIVPPNVTITGDYENFKILDTNPTTTPSQPKTLPSMAPEVADMLRFKGDLIPGESTALKTLARTSVELAIYS